jgi:hypothetical protein
MIRRVVLLGLASMDFALSWGPKGHRIVATVACNYLGSNSALWLKQVLHTSELCTTLQDASLWADEIGQADGSWEYHFVNTPHRLCSPYDEARDCGSGTNRKCLVTGITQYIATAVHESASPVEIESAVKMLIHLIADLHQPMHVGFAEDRGGNGIFLADPLDSSLHEVWDGLIIQTVREVEVSAITKTFRSTKGEFDVTDPDWVNSWVAGIVSHVSEKYTCPVAYKNEMDVWIETGAKLSGAYLQDRSRAASKLLAMAGYRLGRLLNAIGSVWEARRPPAQKVAVVQPVSAPSNRFEVLTIEDIDFVPESIIAEAKVFSDVVRREPPTPEIVNGVDISRMILAPHEEGHGYWCVTQVGRRTSEILSVHAVEVFFPRNDESKRSIMLLLDPAFFTPAASLDSELIIAVVHKLRGSRRNIRAGKAVLPRGKSVPTTEVLHGIFDIMVDDVPRILQHAPGTIVRAPSGAELLGNGRQFCPMPESGADMQRRFDIMKQVAARTYPDIASVDAQIDELALRGLKKHCDSIIQVSSPTMLLFTTTKFLEMSNKEPGKRLRTIAGQVIPDGGNELLLVAYDSRLLEAPASPRIQLFIDECLLRNRNSKVKNIVFRPTIYTEIVEIPTLLIASSLNQEPAVIDQLIVYSHPPLDYAGLRVLEWSIKV